MNGGPGRSGSGLRDECDDERGGTGDGGGRGGYTEAARDVMSSRVSAAVLTDRFREAFHAMPAYVSRAPGRVNLIGEHTDYNDLPVLPMALHKEVFLALRPRDDASVRIANVDPAFEPVSFGLGPDIPPGPRGHWGNYVKAPAQEMARTFGAARGFDGVVGSTVPVASGLSSSSALVNAVGLALARLNGVEIEPLDLADRMARAERYTGTQGGGMDQAISLAARAGYAARIDFAPLRMRYVPVPAAWRFVVADTGVQARKSGLAQEAYNLRTRECGAALARVGAHAVASGLTSHPPEGYPALMRAYGGVAGALEAGVALLPSPLRERYRHVLSEATRVDEAEAALREDDPAAFGALMDASHESLRVDYEVSGPELDELVELAREAGAAGARLTGAGFGGCIVALADAAGADAILDALSGRYYRPRGIDGPLADRAFVATPGPGASFVKLRTGRRLPNPPLP